MGDDKKKKGDDGGQQEMRLKVFARVRPPFPGELEQRGAYMILELHPDRRRIGLRDREYEFDEVFPGDTTQHEIFQKVALPTIEKAFEGFTGTVFVYGQTGTGKTHTMSARDKDTVNQGIIPRSVATLFEKIKDDPSHQYTVTMQYLQLYRDNLQDLQSPDTPFLKLENTPDGGTRIHGVITSPPVTSVDHFFEIYDNADKNRVVAETQMNKQSSRGHSVLTLFITRHAEGNLSPALNGKLVFVDLAGYERIKKTMISDEVRKHEAQAINLSLTALANCITAITAKSSHIPFRNSRLTRILHDSLVGNSVTSVIITMGPSSLHATETINTLFFGHNAIQCKTSVKRDLGPVDWQKECTQMKKKVDELAAQVAQLEAENAMLLQKLTEAEGGDPDLEMTVHGSQRELSRLKSGIMEASASEQLLEELQKARQESEEILMRLERSEDDAEEARLEREEMQILLEQERAEHAVTRDSEAAFRKEVDGLLVEKAQLEASLAEAQRNASLLPEGDLRPGPLPGINGEPVYLVYDSEKYAAWCDLFEAELDRSSFCASPIDRAHWFVAVPSIAQFVADDRKEMAASVEEIRKTSPKHSKNSRPTVAQLRVEGRPYPQETLTVAYEFSGGGSEGESEIQWHVSRDGFDFTTAAKGTRELKLTADMVHHYVRAQITPERRMDGVKGHPTSSGLVYINIDSRMDEQLQAYCTQGWVQFPVRSSSDAVPSTPSVLTIECSGRVQLKSEGSPAMSTTLPASRIRCDGEAGLVVEEVRDGVIAARLFAVAAATPRDRDVIILTWRLFTSLRKPWVSETLLGDAARDWVSGAWMRNKNIDGRRRLLQRLRQVTRSGHWRVEAAGAPSPTRRAGGQATFLQRVEELDLDGEPPAHKQLNPGGSPSTASISKDTLHRTESTRTPRGALRPYPTADKTFRPLSPTATSQDADARPFSPSPGFGKVETVAANPRTKVLDVSSARQDIIRARSRPRAATAVRTPPHTSATASFSESVLSASVMGTPQTTSLLFPRQVSTCLSVASESEEEASGSPPLRSVLSVR